VRRTIGFSKAERLHDLVIGLFINRYEFGATVLTGNQHLWNTFLEGQQGLERGTAKIQYWQKAQGT